MNHRNTFRTSSLLLFAILFLVGTPLSAIAQTPPPKPRPPANRGLVIVTPRRFEAELKGFVEYRRRSLPVEVAILETVLAENPGVDDPEKLKRFLYAAWQKRKAGYVLLVGDATVLPVRYMVLDRVTPAAFDTAFYPSDLYYADVARSDGSFEDWNGRKEGFHAHYFGEVHGEKNKQDPINFDRVHYVPTLAVGRWPVSSPGEVTTLVNKTIAFERRIVAGQAKRPRLGLVNHEGFVNAPRSDGSLGGIDASELGDRKTLLLRCEPAESPAGDRAGGGRSAQLGRRSGGSRGARLGHGMARVSLDAQLGQDQECRTFAGDDFRGLQHGPLRDAPALRALRGYPRDPAQGNECGRGLSQPAASAGGLSDGAFERDRPGPATRYRAGADGAVAYYGCNTGGQPCGITLLEGFVRTWSQGSQPRLGDCWVGAVRYYYDKEKLATLKPNADWYPPSIFFQGMKYMLFGDPCLQLPR